MRIVSVDARRVTASALALLLTAAMGCGSGLYPVQGKVTLDDGSPVTRGLIIFESQQSEAKDSITARGDLQPDGTFRLGTYEPGDGAPAGDYRVLVAPHLDISSPAPDRDMVFDRRYSDFATSGLEFEVKPGPNEFPIRLTKPGKPSVK